MNVISCRYVPSEGKFSGQQGYGYRSIEAFVDAVLAINQGKTKVDECDKYLPTIGALIRG